MSLIHIKAALACDGCGRRFEVTLENAEKPPAGWTLFDVAEDSVRGGDPLGDGEGCSVQEGRHLCLHCTKELDARETEMLP